MLLTDSAAIWAEGNCAIIDGVYGVSDDVASLFGAALVLAGMAADGRTVIEHAERIDRGYQALDVRLRTVGADIRRV